MSIFSKIASHALERSNNFPKASEASLQEPSKLSCATLQQITWYANGMLYIHRDTSWLRFVSVYRLISGSRRSANVHQYTGRYSGQHHQRKKYWMTSYCYFSEAYFAVILGHRSVGISTYICEMQLFICALKSLKSMASNLNRVYLNRHCGWAWASITRYTLGSQ